MSEESSSDDQEFRREWLNVDTDRLKKWSDEYNKPEYQRERERLGCVRSQLDWSDPYTAILDQSRYVTLSEDIDDPEGIRDAAINSIGITVARWAVEPDGWQKIEKLAKAAKNAKKDGHEKDNARMEILKIFKKFWGLGILPTEDQIKARMRFHDKVSRANSYYEKGNFIADLKAVGLGGLRTRGRGRPKGE